MAISTNQVITSRFKATQVARVGRHTIATAGSGLTAPQPLPIQGIVTQTVALKEWNVALKALHRGEQTILVRKGGIREPVFKPEGRSFVLFPTAFHSTPTLLKPQVRDSTWVKEALALEPKEATWLSLDTYVEVTGVWVTEDAGVLAALDPLHIWTQEFVEARLKWRTKQPLTLLELRAWQLQPPLDLKVEQEFFGCFSFVEIQAGLSQPVSLQGAKPALSDEEFAKRQHVLRSKLSGIEHKELVL